MKRYLILFLLVSIVFSMVSCGGGAGSSSSPPGEDPNVPFLIELRPSQSIAQTNTFIYIRARVLNGNGNPIPNIPVTFTNLSSIGELNYTKESSIHHTLTFLANLFSIGGLISTGANTDTNGFATVKLSSTTSGFATIQAEVDTGTGQVRDKKTVYFSLFDMTLPSPPAPSIPYLTLDVDTDGLFNSPNEDSDLNLFENTDDNQVNIRATVFNSNGTPVSGTVVTFGADSTEATFPLENTKTTDANGRASVLVQVDPIILRTATTVLNITASADNGAAGMITLFLQPVVVNTTTSYLTANPTTVPPSGTSAILAVIMLNTGSPAPDGTAVTFTTTCGSVTPFGQTTDGVATATFTAPSIPGTCTVTGRVGGTTIGTAAITVSKTLTVIPTTRTIANPVVGNTATYTILGGTSPYQAFSSNPGVATAVAGSVLTATVASAPTTDTTVTITIYDSVGDSVTASLVLDVPPALPLSVIPTTQTISNPTVGPPRGTATYTILGGTSPYQAFSDNPAVATVAVAGSTLTATVTSVPTTDTTVKITIYDSVGNVSASLVLDVPPTLPLAVIPTTQTKSNPIVGNTATYTVSGGTSPYTAFSDNPALATVSVAGSVVTATVAGVPTTDTTVTITIYDSVGSSKTASLVLDVVPTAALTVTPASITVTGLANLDSNAADDVKFYISGGLGTYSMFSSNGAVIASQGSLGANNFFTIDPDDVATSTSVTLTVEDTEGTIKTVTVTVTPATSAMAVNPSAIVVDGALNITYNILGGVTPYRIYVSDTSVVDTIDSSAVLPVTVTGTTFIAHTAGVPGDATITIVDSDGKTVTATVEVTGADLIIVPGSVAVDGAAPADTPTFTISGGTPPYTTTSSNPTKAYDSTPGDGTWTGSPITVTIPAGACPGSVTLNVFDSVGGTTSATITIVAAALNITPPSATICENASGCGAALPETLNFQISGGVSPYNVTSSNIAVIANPVVNVGPPANFDVNPNDVTADTPVTLTVADSCGTPKTVAVTVINQ
ncbi:MAG: hypothetical protein V1775_14040 [Bacteroidota bacterium]